MRAGPLRYRVRLEHLVAGSPQQKATGEPDKAWATLATVWANIRPLRGQALFAAQQVQERVAVEIDVRYSSEVASLDASMRAVDVSDGGNSPGTVYDIVSVPPPPLSGRLFTLSCSTGANSG